MHKYIWILFVLFLGISPDILLGEDVAPVKLWEEPLVLATYPVHPPDKNPMFRRPLSYQGASRVIYPYPLQDNLSHVRQEKTYRAVYLENEYIKLCVLPELGGRLFYATDKTNQYEMFYRQHVIKPSNIGMLGAWISGGIEWCVFHHHRASTFMPVDYALVENKDGSKTIWIGEIEPRHRMKWSIGISLYPGRSYIEAHVKMLNRTPQVNSILYWANVATHVNEHYQIFFPPDTRFGAYHAKNDFVHWPVAQEKYLKRDYIDVDLSWWKNHPRPVSIFAHHIKEGFLAGYDHQRHAGTVHVANPHIVTGAKLWEWGPGEVGQMWDTRVLTDADGPYAELMAGAYSDNQPDYSWIKPYEVKECKQYWYPLREIGGVKTANRHGALNLERISDQQVKVALNTTRVFQEARFVLQAKQSIVFQKSIDISPARPFSREITLPPNTRETDLQATLYDRDKKTLLTYTPIPKEVDSDLPPPVEPPPEPNAIDTIEELYLTGLRIKQFHNARLNPNEYFQEALKRDPEDSRCNVQLGLYHAERGQYEQAAEKFRTAIKRISRNYTRPRDCEAYYHLGCVLKRQQKLEPAYADLYRAVWDYSFRAAAYYQLAEISCLQNQYRQALAHLNQSLAVNSLNTKALNLKSAVLRKLKQNDDALAAGAKVIVCDPLDAWARYETYLAFRQNELSDRAQKELNQFQSLLRDQPESYLEVAVDYLNGGFRAEAIDLLTLAVQAQKPGLSDYPTIHYYLGYLHQKMGNHDLARQSFHRGRQSPTAYCFPYRLETLDVLDAALKFNPLDARAHYYRGNLLYDRQPEEAIRSWQKAVDIENTLAVAHRNLGWGYYYARDNVPQAIRSYENAVRHDPREPRYYYELDRLYERNNTPIDKRLEVLETHHEHVKKREDALIREIMVLVLAGKYDKAIEYLENHFFHIQEGNRKLHDTHVDAYLLRGRSYLHDRKYQQALQDCLLADKYPENHQIGRDRSYRRNPQIYYHLGLCHEALGNQTEAQEFFQKALDQNIGDSEYMYYQGLAYRKLDRTEKASEIWDQLIRRGQDRLQEKTEVDFFAKFGAGDLPHVRRANAHYMIGLGYWGKGMTDQARTALQKAVELNVNHLWAQMYLRELTKTPVNSSQ